MVILLDLFAIQFTFFGGSSVLSFLFLDLGIHTVLNICFVDVKILEYIEVFNASLKTDAFENVKQFLSIVWQCKPGYRHQCYGVVHKCCLAVVGEDRANLSDRWAFGI